MTVSVIMPAYNAEDYIGEAIDSILCQDFKDFELIIINDGSTDRTKNIILTYSDPRILYVENKVNMGICHTLNRGLDAARGEYIARMDSDDISLPQRLGIQVAFLNNNPDVAVVGSDVEMFGEGISPSVFYQQHTPEECAAGLLFSSCLAHPAVMMRRSVLDGFSLRYDDGYRGLEDYELWWRILPHGKINNIVGPLLRYRLHPKQVTHNMTSKEREALRAFAKRRLIELHIELEPEDFELFMRYTEGNFKAFDDVALSKYISVCRQIIRKYPCQTLRERQALKLTLAKAVTYILLNTNAVKGSRLSYYIKSFLAGVFPLKWFLKVTARVLIK